MSPTTAHLRERMARELDVLEPMPDVVPAAERAGAVRLRRRRVAGVAVAATVAVVGAVALSGLNAGPDRPDPGPAGDGAVEAVEPPDPIALALRDGVVTQAEWYAAQQTVFGDLLPARFGDVRLVERSGQPPLLGTRVSGQDVELHFAIQGYRGSRELQPGSEGCDGLRQTAAEAPFRWDILDCAYGSTGPGITVQADAEYSVAGDSGGAGSYASAVVMVGDGVFMEIGLVADNGRSRLDLSADEMLEMVRDPGFLELAELGTEYVAAQSWDPDEITIQPPDPVWPGAATN